MAQGPTGPLQLLAGLLLWCGLAAPADTSDLGLSSTLLDEVAARYGTAARDHLRAWQELIDALNGRTVAEQLEAVNRFFNQVPFAEDRLHWQQDDYWATPAELLVTQGGDCEDYAIAKYYTLRALGVPTGDLRLHYVRAKAIDQPHMVLAWSPATAGADPLVLDNLDPRIKPASARPDLQPVYSFNGDGLWLARQRGRTVRIGDADQLDLWRALRRRMANIPTGGTGP